MQKLYNETNVENIAEAIRDRIGYEGKNLFDIYKQKLERYISYDEQTQIYSASDYDDRSTVQYKIQQYDNTSFITGTQILKTISNIGIISFTTTRVENAKQIRIANNGATREFSLLYPIPDNIKIGDSFTVSLEIIDMTIGASKFKNIQLEQGTELTEYEPYDLKYKLREMAPAIMELPSKKLYEKALANQVSNTATGSDVYLEGSADMPFKKLEVQGNTEQGENPTPDNPQEIRCVGQNGSAIVKVQNRNLWDENTRLGFYNDNGIYTTRTDVLSSQNPIYLSVNKTYYFVTPSKIFITEWKKDGTFIKRNSIERSTTYTIDSECNYIHFNMVATYGTTYNNDIAIVEGTSGSYVSHAEQVFTIPVQQEMCKIGDVKDRFTKIDGKWYEEHGVGKVVLDGSDDEQFGKRYSQIQQGVAIYSMELEHYANGISTHFNKIYGNTAYYGIGINFNKSNSIIWINVPEKISPNYNVDEWKTWLSTHNTEIYYQLINSELIECTPEQTEILNKLQEALTYQGGTHVSATSENANPILDVEYFIDKDYVQTAMLNAEPEI